MSRPARKWADLRAPQYPKVDPAATDFAVAMFRLSLIPDFQNFMGWLRATSTEMTLPPTASDSALRMLEGRRQVPRDIEGLIERGRSESARPKSDESKPGE